MDRGREQKLFRDQSTVALSLYARIINFVEDVIDDSFCETARVSIVTTGGQPRVYIDPVGCRYNPRESVRVFASEWDLEAAVWSGGVEYTSLYHDIVNRYLRTLHFMMKGYAAKSFTTRREYYLAVSFNGDAVILEGEANMVRIPFFKQCFSAHTHPSKRALPSRKDIATIMDILLNRGIGHAIEAVGETIVFYRVAPLTEDDLILLRRVEASEDLAEAVSVVNQSGRIRIVRIQ